jgi:hypothetical protein
LEFLLKNSDTGAANSDLSGCWVFTPHSQIFETEFITQLRKSGESSHLWFTLHFHAAQRRKQMIGLGKGAVVSVGLFWTENFFSGGCCWMNDEHYGRIRLIDFQTSPQTFWIENDLTPKYSRFCLKISSQFMRIFISLRPAVVDWSNDILNGWSFENLYFGVLSDNCALPLDSLFSHCSSSGSV